MRVFFPGGGGAGAPSEIWHTKVRAGAAFSRGHEEGTTAGTFSWIQILNPAASGVQVVVYAWFLSAQTSGNIIDGREYDTAGATLVGAGVNLLSGGAAAAATIYADRTAALPGTIMNRWRITTIGISIPQPWALELAPGQGFVFANSTLATPVGVNLWWYEQ